MKNNSTTNRKLMIVITGLLIVTACSQQSPPEELATVAEPSQAELEAKGEYLVGIMGCHDCHTPKIYGPQGPTLDTDRLLSGHPPEAVNGNINPAIFSDWVLLNHHFTSAAGPWGVSFSGNLTSDETGIGNWTFDNFKKAMKEGKYKGLDGSRTLLPPMPWQNFANITDDDLKAIFAYLKSTKPIRNVVPAPVPPTGAPVS